MLARLIPWYLRSARHPLKQKFVGRYWHWFTREPVWIRYDGTLRFKADLRDYLQQKVFYEGYYEPKLVAWLKQSLRPGDVFWDVGANVGVMTLVAAKACGRVFAFEPEPRARRHLEENLAANGFGHVTVVPVALAAEDATARLTLGPDSNRGMHSLVPGAAGAAHVEVPTRRADSLVAEGAVAAPNVMKVDVEGAEALVFAGADRMLRDPALRAIVFESREDASGDPADRALVAGLEARGFAVRGFGRSDPSARDGMNNFIATRTP